jgi:hypothetical protein
VSDAEQTRLFPTSAIGDSVAGDLTETGWRNSSPRVEPPHSMSAIADAVAAARAAGLDDDDMDRAVRLSRSLVYDDTGVRLDEETSLKRAGELVDDPEWGRAADDDACGVFDPGRVREFVNGNRWVVWCVRRADHTEGLHFTYWRRERGT